MEERINAGRLAPHNDAESTDWGGLDLRPQTEFPTFTEEMVERLKP